MVTQVHHAEQAGAVGAIVYDDVYEALIIMSKPRDHEDPGIPAVFVAQKTGIMVKKLMSPGATIVRITPVRCTPLELYRCASLEGAVFIIWDAVALQIADAVWMSMLLSAFAGVLAVTVVVATFYFIRCTSLFSQIIPYFAWTP